MFNGNIIVLQPPAKHHTFEITDSYIHCWHGDIMKTDDITSLGRGISAVFTVSIELVNIVIRV